MADSIGTWVDNAHEEISRQVVGTADRFDGFFGDDRVDEEKQNTQISLGMTTTLGKHDTTLFTFPIGIKLALPRLKNRFQLAIDTLLKEQAGEEGIFSGLKEGDSPDIKVSIRYRVWEKVSEWVSVDSGVRMNTETIGLNTLEPFGSLRFRATVDSDPWATRFTQLVDWYEQTGWSGLSRFDLERYIGQNTFLRLSETTEYAEEFDGQKYTPTLFLRYQLSNNRAIGLQFHLEGHTKPEIQVDMYEAQLTYRRRIYKEWAFLSIEPIAQFPREEDFAFTPLLRFELELYFGRVSP
jgi:hypothetical protein